MVDDIMKWGTEMGKYEKNGGKGAKYKDWADFAHRQVIATGDLIDRCIHMDGAAQDHMERGG